MQCTESGQFDSVQPLVPTVVIGGLGRLTGSLEWTWIALHGLLPALTWLLVYAIARRYTRSRALAEATQPPNESDARHRSRDRPTACYDS